MQQVPVVAGCSGGKKQTLLPAAYPPILMSHTPQQVPVHSLNFLSQGVKGMCWLPVRLKSPQLSLQALFASWDMSSLCFLR